jgi:hypothetical protein
MVIVRRVTTRIIAPLAIGVLVYVAFRAPNVRVVTWFPRGVVAWLHALVAHVAMPAFVAGSLPDLAWAFAFGAALALVWDGASLREKTPWLVAGGLLAVGVELGQAVHVVPGTFDIVDLVAITLGYLAAALAPAVKKQRAT